MATFALSTYGQSCLIDEGTTHLSAIRWVFIIVTAFLGLLVKIFECKVFWSVLMKGKQSCLITSLWMVYVCNSVIHTIHYADNIAHPVDYHEPEWLYCKYILSPMEITFYVNFPITFAGYKATIGLLRSVTEGDGNVTRYCGVMLLYVVGSLLTLGHYLNEPPSSYEPWVNFTIGGEGIFAVLLAIVVVRIYYLNRKKRLGPPAEGFIELIADDNSDDQELDTFNRDTMDKTRRRRSRSRSPEL